MADVAFHHPRRFYAPLATINWDEDTCTPGSTPDLGIVLEGCGPTAC